MFETFDVAGLYIANPSELAMYSNGITTGVICDSGHDLTQVISIYEGNHIPTARKTNQFAGLAVTEHLINLLKVEGIIENSGISSWK